LRPASDISFYQVNPKDVKDDSPSDPYATTWYRPGDINSPRPRDGVGDDSKDRRGDSEVEAIWAFAENDEYELIREQSTCFDTAALANTNITESDVSDSIEQSFRTKRFGIGKSDV